MKKGKIFTNCLFSIWTLSVILSFASCSSDGDSISIIDERVPLETEAPFSVNLYKEYSYLKLNELEELPCFGVMI